MLPIKWHQRIEINFTAAIGSIPVGRFAAKAPVWSETKTPLVVMPLAKMQFQNPLLFRSPTVSELFYVVQILFIGGIFDGSLYSEYPCSCLGVIPRHYTNGR